MTYLKYVKKLKHNKVAYVQTTYVLNSFYVSHYFHFILGLRIHIKLTLTMLVTNLCMLHHCNRS